MSIYLEHPGVGSGTVRLIRWAIRELESGSRHFLGYNLDAHDGRVSTRIVEIDPIARWGRTESGRRYELVGQAGHDDEAEYVWSMVTRSDRTWRDVTEVLIPGAYATDGDA
jgi:hypothetical protein